MNNIKKDIQRGTARLAEGASLLGDGSQDSDFAHCSTSSPIALKQKELRSDPRYRTDLDAGINDVRQQETTRKRMDQEVKPI